MIQLFVMLFCMNNEHFFVWWDWSHLIIIFLQPTLLFLNMI